ncbi:hypothetical protein J6590_076003 [Homalodisca vitripennis]|nr:hypothetical protein J6590_076003 [Homalodisca vitripennis]
MVHFWLVEPTLDTANSDVSLASKLPRGYLRHFTTQKCQNIAIDEFINRSSLLLRIIVLVGGAPLVHEVVQSYAHSDCKRLRILQDDTTEMWYPLTPFPLQEFGEERGQSRPSIVNREVSDSAFSSVISQQRYVMQPPHTSFVKRVTRPSHPSLVNKVSNSALIRHLSTESTKVSNSDSSYVICQQRLVTRPSHPLLANKGKLFGLLIRH